VLSWTTEKPTKQGWYWWRMKQSAPAVTELVTRYGELFDEFKKHSISDYPDGQIEWAGPLEPPPEGETKETGIDLPLDSVPPTPPHAR